MAKKIKNSDIVDANLFTGLIKQANELKTAILGVQEAIKGSLKVQTEFLKTQKIDSFKSYKETEEAIKKTKKATDDLSQSQKELAKVEKDIIFLQTEESKALSEKKMILSALKKAQQDEINLNNTQAGSINRLTQENKKLIAERNKLNLQTTQGLKRSKEINAELDRNNKLIKQNSSALEKQKINVGNYTKSIVEAAKSSNLLGGSLGNAITSMEGVAAAGGVMAGVLTGGVILALGGVGLILAKTEVGLDLVARETERVTSIMGTMADRLLNLNFKNFWEDLKQAGQAGADYADALDDLEDKIIANTKAQAQLNLAIAKNKLAMEDANATTEDKLRLARESIALDVKRTGVDLTESGQIKIVGAYDINTLIGQARKRFTETKQYYQRQNRELTEDEKRNLAELEAAQYNVAQEAFVGRKKLASQIENLEKELANERFNRDKNNRQREIFLMEEGAKKEIETVILKYKEIERQAIKNKENMVLVEENKQKEIADIQAKYAKEFEDKVREAERLANEEESNGGTFNAPVGFTGTIADIDLEDQRTKAQEALDLEKEFYQKALEIRKQFTDSAIEQIIKEYDAKISFQEKEIDRRKDNIETQTRLAESGQENQLAFEKKKLAEAEAEEKRLQKEKLKREKEIALYRLIASYAEQGNGALLKASADMSGAKIVSAFLWEGAEKISDKLKGKAKAHNGRDGYRGVTKDGHVIALDGKERVFTADQNSLIGDISNDKAAQIIYEHKLGEKEQKRDEQDANAIMLANALRKIEETMKQQKTINVNWASMDKRIVETVEYGMKKTVKHINSRPKI